MLDRLHPAFTSATRERRVSSRKSEMACIRASHSYAPATGSGFALRQSEMFNPRTRSHDGNGRMGMAKAFKALPKPRMSPERPYEILGHRPWPKEASRRADANCLRPVAEFSRPSGRGLRPVRNFVQAVKGICKKTTQGTITAHTKPGRAIIKKRAEKPLFFKT